jgi:hypothetical protein
MPIPENGVVHSWYDLLYSEQRYQLHLTFKATSATSLMSTEDQLVALNALLANPALSPLVDYLAILGNDVEVVRVNSQLVAPTRSAYVSDLIGQMGTDVNGTPTGNVAATLTMHTPNAGRNQIAIKKIGPLPQGTYSDGGIDGAFAIELATLGAALLTQKSVDGANLILTPCIWHAPTPAADILTNFRVGDRAVTMRRRTLRNGI